MLSKIILSTEMNMKGKNSSDDFCLNSFNDMKVLFNYVWLMKFKFIDVLIEIHLEYSTPYLD